MKKFLICLCAVTMVFGMVGVASAISYEDTHSKDPFLLSTGDSYSWTFDIAQYGFNPEEQDLISADITLSLTDDGGCFDFWEFAKLDVGENNFYWEVDTGEAEFTIMSLMTLSETGKVEITLTALWGDFYFNSAALFALATDPGSSAAPVPEPSTILLMGTGILGLVAYGRKRYHKKA